MPWYFYSILTSLSFVGLYLCIKWLASKGFASKQILLFMVAFAIPGFLAATAPSIQNVLISEQLLSFLAVIAVTGIFSSIGHWTDFEAIKRAPNPGFANAVRNSTILPVTIFSVFLFGSSFHFLKLFGALLILIGIVFMVIEWKSSSEKQETGQSAKNHWVGFSLLAVVCYTLMVFGMKKATLLGFSPPEICLSIYIINLIFFTIICRKELKKYFQDRAKLRSFVPVALLTAFFALLANLLNVKGLAVAPNPGYHEAIRNTNVLFVTLLAIPLFSASFDKQKILGVVIIIAGTIVLII